MSLISKTKQLAGSLLFLGQLAIAQQDGHHTHEEHVKSGPRLTALMAYSFISNNVMPESNSVLVVPTIGLNFDYQLNSHWGLGLHSDILLQQFKLEQHNGHNELVRENPVALCAMAFYKPHHSWTFYGGYGVEIEKHHNLQLIRLAGEYGITLPRHWEACLSVEYDIKQNTNNAILFGIGFSKSFNH